MRFWSWFMSNSPKRCHTMLNCTRFACRWPVVDKSLTKTKSISWAAWYIFRLKHKNLTELRLAMGTFRWICILCLHQWKKARRKMGEWGGESHKQVSSASLWNYAFGWVLRQTFIGQVHYLCCTETAAQTPSFMPWREISQFSPQHLTKHSLLNLNWYILPAFSSAVVCVHRRHLLRVWCLHFFL